MATWPEIQAGIFAGESGGDYGALFGFSNRDEGRFSDVNLTNMTVDEWIGFSNPRGPYGQWVKGKIGYVATPMGGYQIVGSTLREAKNRMGLTGSEKMTPAMQDRVGKWILDVQGTGAWEGYRGPRNPTDSGSPSRGTGGDDAGRETPFLPEHGSGQEGQALSPAEGLILGLLEQEAGSREKAKAAAREQELAAAIEQMSRREKDQKRRQDVDRQGLGALFRSSGRPALGHGRMREAARGF